MKLSTVTSNQHGEPTVTITLEGFHEMYRFAHHLTLGQVEFGAIGHKIIGRLRRRSTAESWAYQMRILHGIRPLDSIDWRDRHGSPEHMERLADRLDEIADHGLTEDVSEGGRGDEKTLRNAAAELRDLAIVQRAATAAST